MPPKPNLHPSAVQRRRWQALAEMGCIVGLLRKGRCKGRRTIHHLYTSGSSPRREARANHDHTICLCHNHHQGKEGIDRREFGAAEEVFDWEERFGSETFFLEETNKLLEREYDQ